MYTPFLKTIIIPNINTHRVYQVNIGLRRNPSILLIHFSFSWKYGRFQNTSKILENWLYLLVRIYPKISNHSVHDEYIFPDCECKIPQDSEYLKELNCGHSSSFKMKHSPQCPKYNSTWLFIFDTPQENGSSNSFLRFNEIEISARELSLPYLQSSFLKFKVYCLLRQ